MDTQPLDHRYRNGDRHHRCEVWLSDPDYQLLRQLARADDCSQSGIIRLALKYYFAQIRGLRI